MGVDVGGKESWLEREKAITRMKPIIMMLLLFLSYLFFFQAYIKVCAEHMNMQNCVETARPSSDGNGLSISILQTGKLRPGSS